MQVFMYKVRLELKGGGAFIEACNDFFYLNDRGLYNE